MSEKKQQVLNSEGTMEPGGIPACVLRKSYLQPKGPEGNRSGGEGRPEGRGEGAPGGLALLRLTESSRGGEARHFHISISISSNIEYSSCSAVGSD